MAARRLLLFDVDGVLIEKGELRRPPGAAEALAQLRHDGNAVLSLLTEEDEAGARRRTDKVGVDRYLDLDVASCGPAAQVSFARQKAEDGYGCEFTVVAVTAASTADVARARPQADIVVAVDPTETAGDELRAAGADQVVTTLLGVVELAKGSHVG
ncbi:hypothetical protein [Amycolatopsis nigrescens]|uniref:hypothetical protein n=1 Tax=Amycolatopsis nigrescens TaxID=381445 RepID=UPI00037077B3|nr:hypothetical protein [Amycolatopsis nigrescens]